jgi:hypothetical protein
MSPTDQAKLDAICKDAFARLDAMDATMYGHGWVTRDCVLKRMRATAEGAPKPVKRSNGPSAPLINSPVPVPRMPSPSVANR